MLLARLIPNLGLLMLIAILAACVLPPADNPRAVAELFLNHLKMMEFKEASTVATDTAKQTLLYLDSLKDSLPQDRIDQSRAKALTILSVKENGDTATVVFRMGNDDQQNLDLIKESGEWKVDFKKQI